LRNRAEKIIEFQQKSLQHGDITFPTHQLGSKRVQNTKPGTKFLKELKSGQITKLEKNDG